MWETGRNIKRGNFDQENKTIKCYENYPMQEQWIWNNLNHSSLPTVIKIWLHNKPSFIPLKAKRKRKGLIWKISYFLLLNICINYVYFQLQIIRAYSLATKMLSPQKPKIIICLIWYLQFCFITQKQHDETSWYLRFRWQEYIETLSHAQTHTHTYNKLI